MSYSWTESDFSWQRSMLSWKDRQRTSLPLISFRPLSLSTYVPENVHLLNPSVDFRFQFLSIISDSYNAQQGRRTWIVAAEAELPRDREPESQGFWSTMTHFSRWLSMQAKRMWRIPRRYSMAEEFSTAKNVWWTVEGRLSNRRLQCGKGLPRWSHRATDLLHLRADLTADEA